MLMFYVNDLFLLFLFLLFIYKFKISLFLVYFSEQTYVFKINYGDYMMQNNSLKLQKLLPS